MSSYIEELRNDALNQNVPVTSLLRKTLVAAHELEIEEMRSWAFSELEGYKSSDKVPSYRKVRGAVKAWNPFHGWQPVRIEDEKTRRVLTECPIMLPISEIEHLLENTKVSGTLQIPLPDKIQLEVMKMIRCDTPVTRFIQEASLARIRDAIRNAVLEWALKLKGKGITGENMTFSPQEKKTAENITNILNFYGDVTNSQIQQDAVESAQCLNAQGFDLKAIGELMAQMAEAVNNAVLENNVKNELLAEIETIKAQLASPKPKPTILRECLGSIRSILEGMAGSLLASGFLTKISAFLSQ